MAATAAAYQTIVTPIPIPAGTVGKLVGYNPKRWYIRIWISGGAGNSCQVAPAPLPTGTVQFPTNTSPVESKFRDAPAMTTGEWYGFGIAGLFYHVWEQILTDG